MVTKIGFVLGLLAILALMPVVFAEEIEKTQILELNQTLNQTTEATELNESDVSGFKVLMQQFKIAFEPNLEKKVKLELELARLRLIQAKIAAKNNNTVAMERALEAHDRIIEGVKARVEAISNKGGNLTGLERAIQVHERRIELLNEILAKVNLTEEERAKVEARLEHVENVTAKLKELQQKIENKTETLQNRTEEMLERHAKIEEKIRNKTNKT
jgi:predicted DNA-binding antitoxin AbrB/MazE fold protein